MIRPTDFRSVVRRGRRINTDHSVIHVLRTSDGVPPRVGFVVTKAVGNSVTRNLVKRRLRAIAAEALPAVGVGADIVVRALPASAEANWVTLHSEISKGISMGMARA